MLRLTLARLQKKKVMALIPLFVSFVLLPLMGLFFCYRYEGDTQGAVREFTLQMHVWIPLFSAWWGLVLFQDFFESGGNELLYLYHHPPYFLKIQCAAVLLYSFCIAACFLICRQICRQFIPLEWFLVVQLLAESFFAAALAYFLYFAFLNTGAGLLIVAAYCIYLNLFDTLGMLDFISVFPKYSDITAENVRLIECSCLSALIFLVLGFLCSKFHKDYN